MLKKEINGNIVCLIQTEMELDSLISKIQSAEKTNFGLDTETQGLDFLLHKVVGYCIGVKTGLNYTGWYLPFRHIYGKQLPAEKIHSLLEALSRHSLILFNKNFDISMIEHTEGYVFPETTTMHDVQIMYWNAFSVPYPSLKDCYTQLVKKPISTFDETTKGDYNFGNTDPEFSYTYGAYDPIATLELGAKIQQTAPYIRKIYPLDNKLTDVIRENFKTPVYLDQQEVSKFTERLDRELRSLQKQIYDEVGYPFKINSNKEKAEALNRVVTLTTKTAKGAFKVSQDVLENIDHPLADMMIKFSSTEDLQSKVRNLVGVESFRNNYNTCSAPTGRLSSGGSAKNSYFGQFNIQATPKEVEKLYVHPHEKLGLTLKLEPNEDGTFAYVKSHLRRIFKAPEGYSWLSFDYSQAELRILANVSNDRSMAEAFNSGRDFHTESAKRVFGIETKEARDRAKAVSFSIVFGSTAYSLAKKFGISQKEAQSVIDAYYAEFRGLKNWMDYQKKLAKRQGIVYTYYGRPRYLRQYYDNSDPKQHAFGDRSAVNTVAQGTCADVLRMMVVKLNQHFKKNPSIAEKLTFAFSVYDELNFYVKDGYEEEMYNMLGPFLHVKPDNWNVPLIVEGGLGTNWGSLIDNCVFEGGKIVGGSAIKKGTMIAA